MNRLTTFFPRKFCGNQTILVEAGIGTKDRKTRLLGVRFDTPFLVQLFPFAALLGLLCNQQTVPGV